MARFSTVGGGSSGSVVAPFSDSFSLRIIAQETNTSQTDTASYSINLALSDTNATQTENVSLNLRNISDSNIVPTDTRSTTLRYWQSGSTGTSNVTNPSNANGSNDAANATLTTTVAGANSSVLTSPCGTNIPSISFSTAIYRGWYSYTNSLGTSSFRIVARSSGALYSDVTMLNVTTGTSSSTGTFTFNLISAGIDTLAKLQSTQFIYTSTDATAGVGQGTALVDAGCIELTGVF